MNAAPTTAQHQLLRLIRSLNNTATTIGPGRLAELQALAQRAAHEYDDLPSSELDRAVACARTEATTTGNTHLPEALRPHAVPRFHAPRTYQHIQLHGVTLLDHTVTPPGWDAAGLPRRDVIWLALDLEGRALQAAQALEVAEAMRLMATAQIKRLQATAHAEGGQA
ncbi:hypothetical protein [Paracidovorax wautersii]|uniref:Uncharacterized protein n=1 Tax=Paracidovorax wautersii TaxID=1177982 RepID=A0A1I2E6V4_9BURK|nr:hypothetical protein [Paracidovorax wautersii]SFE88359.1 hypothetical protein SAMN04489711_106255 [Paracidovorax wautersii]